MRRQLEALCANSMAAFKVVRRRLLKLWRQDG
jgi:hypothetical protein